MVDIQLRRKLGRLIPLSELKSHPALSDMALLKKGNRLSVMPVEERHWQTILSLE